MSTKAKTNDLSVDKINEGLYMEHLGMNTTPIDRDAAFDFFENAADGSFETIGGGEYLNFDKCEPGKFVFIFTGTTSWVDNTPRGGGKTVTAVKLEDRDGKQWICAASLIVEALTQVQSMPCMIRVEYKGKKTSKSGNTFFDLIVQVGKGVLTPAQTGE